MLNSPKSMRDDDISSMDFINTIPYLCPKVEAVFLGYKQGGRPHSLCENAKYDLAGNYAHLRKFEATGNITTDALAYLWQRARKLEHLKISGK